MSYLTMDDVDFKATRSGGPGGQHSDRRATAVRLRVTIDEIPLSEDNREDLRNYLPPRCLTQDDELIVENADSRSQMENRQLALEQANSLIDEALDSAEQKREKRRRTRRAQNSGGGGGGKDIKEEKKKRRRSESTEDLLREAIRQDPEILESYVDTDQEELDEQS